MLSRSENIRDEYSAQVVRIGALEPIENSDFLVKTMINDSYQVVVGKNDVQEGQIMVYCKLETAINTEFLSVNNQFELGERSLNKNYDEVESLLGQGKMDEAKKMVGYFNKHGRVRIVRLRGCPSEGCLFTIDSLVKWDKSLSNENWEQYITVDENGNVIPFNFDTINNKLFVKAYVPATNVVSSRRTDRATKRNRKLKRFNRMVEGQFSYHYDTSQLSDNMWRFKPDDIVDISCKCHGASQIVGNLLVKKPLPVTIPRKIVNKKLERELKMLFRQKKHTYWEKSIVRKRASRINEILNSNYVLEYGNVTSSRGVIKNQYINKNVTPGFYGKDIWSEYGNLLYPYIEKGLTVYSEICGYVTGTSSFIQGKKGEPKNSYDYGCNPGENYIMPYRITFTSPNGEERDEWNVQEVYGWTLKLLKEHPELEGKVKPMEILYHGRLGDLYPDIDTSEHWNANVLARLKEDKEHFGMEEREPLCKNKVPREGIVIRIENDPKSEAFKLKTTKFKEWERGKMDAGDVDIEMDGNY